MRNLRNKTDKAEGDGEIHGDDYFLEIIKPLLNFAVQNPQVISQGLQIASQIIGGWKKEKVFKEKKFVKKFQ